MQVYGYQDFTSLEVETFSFFSLSTKFTLVRIMKTSDERNEATEGRMKEDEELEKKEKWEEKKTMRKSLVEYESYVPLSWAIIATTALWII